MIPTRIAQADADWLAEVLGLDVVDAIPTQIGEGIGIMGDIYRMALSYRDKSNAGPRSVVVKLPSSHEENRAQGVALGMFAAEVRFYNELAGEVSVGLPQIFRAEIESGTANFVIVMEDLSHLTLVSQAEGMTADQAHAAVQVLAHTHAAWWDRVDSEDMAWIPSMVGPRIEFVDQLLVEILPLFLDGFGAVLPEGGREVYERFAGNYLKVNRVIAGRSPWTLVHQDYRVENLLFGDPGTNQVVVLDWQGIGRGPGAYDLAYLIGGSMQPELRRQHEQNLLDTYYRQLVELGVNGYTRNQLDSDYALGHLQGGLATAMVIGGGMDLSNARGRELVATMASRHVTAALDHDGLALLTSIT